MRMHSDLFVFMALTCPQNVLIIAMSQLDYNTLSIRPIGMPPSNLWSKSVDDERTGNTWEARKHDLHTRCDVAVPDSQLNDFHG